MPVPWVASASGSFSTWAPPATTAEKGEGKAQNHQRLASSYGSFPREMVRNGGSETELDQNGWGHVPIETGTESDPAVWL